MENIVRVWEEKVTIPTYPIGKPEKNPIFLEKRVYQGSSGVVYPHPVIEKIHDEKVDKEYVALFLENYYIKIMILPELGGRIQMAYDKIKQRHFVYYNQVIKPALVGLTGPWISGGIEFNWPQHHRPSTFDPIDYRIEQNDDGSATVWVNEVERMFRTKGMAGFTLYPDKAYLEIKAQLYNRTPFPQTFLWWANPAVHVNDDYQSVFPPDVNAVFDHGKRDVSDFPVATGTYYKVNYAPGTDISRYKNIPVPTSYMAIKSEYDFVGGYEHDTKGGLLHVANHHVSPGKKQWTWGNGDFGQAWDRNLTDEDGPYIELMTGVFTDNQPDFSWIMPGEERSFTQYFMPYSEVGMVKNATKDALVNLDMMDGRVSIACYATAVYQKATVTLTDGDNKTYLNKQIHICPEKPFITEVEVAIGASNHLKFSLSDEQDNILVSYLLEPAEKKDIPKPATAALSPEQTPSIEQLYLTGLHLEQYRHATFKPEDYYAEALKREAGDIRCNNAMGLLLLRGGKFAEAEPYFKKAIATVTERNPNPYDGEALYNLGRCLQFQYKKNEAYEFFYKAAWNAAWQDNAYFALAQLETAKKNYKEAFNLIEKSLIRNWHHHKARHLKAALLRKLNRQNEAIKWIEQSLVIDHFNIGCHIEKYFISNAEVDLLAVQKLQRQSLHNYIEYALDYAWCGLYEDGITFLLMGVEEYQKCCSSAEEQQRGALPMALYYLGWMYEQIGDTVSSIKYFNYAAEAKPDYCFPNQLEAIGALQCAVLTNPKDARAHYYLGNLWYAFRRYDEAITCWEKSASIDALFPTVHRNLALAYYNKRNNAVKALHSLEKAFALDSTDGRVLMELDQLYKKLNQPFDERLALLEKHMDLTLFRDDLYLERIILYNQLGQYKKAHQLIAERKFHPWEGGEGKVIGQYLLCHIELAKQALKNQSYIQAHELLDAVTFYPHNLGEGKLYGARENDIYFFKALAYKGVGNNQQELESLQKAVSGMTELSLAMYYNDQQPDKIFYQGLALLHMNRQEEAQAIFENLYSYGNIHVSDQVKTDYFAVSLPDLLIFEEDLSIRNSVHCHYLMGLGALGTGKWEDAECHFRKVLAVNRSHQGAQVHMQWLNCNWAKSLVKTVWKQVIA